jgi:hypothetical protein
MFCLTIFAKDCRISGINNVKTNKPIAQSICTHYSNLSGRPDIFLGSGTLKKSGPQKSRVQKNRVFITRIVGAD